MNMIVRFWGTVGKYHKEISIGCALAVITFFVYARAVEHEFVIFDDTSFITENHYVLQGFTRESLAWAFGFTDLTYWKPLTWLSHMLDYKLYGLNAGMHVMTSLIIHIASTLLLFAGLRYMTGSIWKSACVAGLFALHPINVDSVAWVSERKNVLSTFFWFLSIVSYAWYSKNRQVKYYSLTILAFIIGLMAKPMLITLPFVFLLIDYWPLKRISAKKYIFPLLIEKLPFMAISALSVYFTLTRLGGDVVSTESVSMMMRLGNALISYAAYLYNMAVPVNLAVFYPFPESISVLKVMLSSLLLISISVVSLVKLTSRPWLFTGWFWYIGTFIPAIGLVQGGLWPAMADRFAYIPLVGVFIIIVWEAGIFIDRYRQVRFLAPAIIIVTGISLCFITYIQTGYWKNSITLFQHAIDVTDDNYVAHNNIGVAFKRKNLTELAYQHFTEAVRLRPNYSIAHNNIGEILAEKGDYSNAESYFMKSLETTPSNPVAMNNLGSIRIKQGRLDEAIKLLKNTIIEKPDYAVAYNNLGSVMLIKGLNQDAIHYYRKALKFDNELCKARTNLAYALFITDNFIEAVEAYRHVISKCQINAEVYKFIGIALVRLDRYAEAEDHFIESLKTKPDDYETMFHLARVYSKTGKFSKAIDMYQAIIRKRPDIASIYYNLACLYARMKETENSFKWLNIAVDKGYDTMKIRTDPDLESIRNDPRYLEIIRNIE